MFVRHPDAGALHHARVPGHHAFDFIRKDIKAGYQDHVFFAIDDAGIAALVHDADVA